MDLEFRNLGQSGLKVSNLCLGAMMFGHRTDEPHAHRIVHCALEHGVNFIDTANVYAEGLSEEIVGRAIKGRRNKVILATKVCGKVGGEPNDGGLSRRHILMEVDNSLRRLDTDWIDLYQLHRTDPSTPAEETLATLDGLVRQGKIRYWGFSNFPAWTIAQWCEICRRNAWTPPVTDQPVYNLLRRQIENEHLGVYREFGIGLMPYSPLSGGILSGKYKRGTPVPEDSKAAHRPRFAANLTDGVFGVLERLEQRAASLGKTLGQYALAWVLSNPSVTAPISGPRTLDQWEENLGAFGWEFPQDEIAFVNRLAKEINDPVPIKFWRETA